MVHVDTKSHSAIFHFWDKKLLSSGETYQWVKYFSHSDDQIPRLHVKSGHSKPGLWDLSVSIEELWDGDLVRQLAWPDLHSSKDTLSQSVKARIDTPTLSSILHIYAMVHVPHPYMYTNILIYVKSMTFSLFIALSSLFPCRHTTTTLWQFNQILQRSIAGLFQAANSSYL